MEPHSQDAQAGSRTTLETDSVTETKAGKETVGADGHAQRPTLYLLATCFVITPLPDDGHSPCLTSDLLTLTLSSWPGVSSVYCSYVKQASQGLLLPGVKGRLEPLHSL